MAFIVERNPATVPQLKVKLKDAPVYVGLPERESAPSKKINTVWRKPRPMAEKWVKQPLSVDL